MMVLAVALFALWALAAIAAVLLLDHIPVSDCDVLFKVSGIAGLMSAAFALIQMFVDAGWLW